jgi:cytochrome c553
MKYTAPAVLILAAGLVASVIVTLDEASTEALAGEPSAKKSEPAEPSPADNSACFVCHANYEKEQLVGKHAHKGVGCTDCHGDSEDHADDEGHEIPPEKMYLAEMIAPACGECHETHDASAKRVLARWKARKLTDRDPAKVLCTDCHGRHRLEKRTVRWDRKTGKLIFTEESDAKEQ